MQTTLIDGDREKWRNILDLNVLGLCIAPREAVEIMRANNINGHIRHISSVTGHIVPNFPDMNVYPSIKHAVTALTGTLRPEFNHIGSKIKITSISSGLVESETTTLNKDLPPEIKEMVLALPYIKPEDIADAVVYALSTLENVQIQELKACWRTI